MDSKDKLILCKAYAKSGRKEKAKDLLKTITYDEEILNMAKKDKVLSIILRDINRDIEAEEEKRKKEEQERIEKERKEQEAREKEEEARRKELEKQESDKDNTGINNLE